MKACEDIRAQCYPYLDGALEADQVVEIEAHLATCPACVRIYSGERSFLHAVREAGREPAPESLRARVAGMFDGPTPVEVAEPAPPRALPAETRPAGLPWIRLAIPLAAAAALALLLLGPWGGNGSDALAEGFVADHAAHAATRPGAHPSDAGETMPVFPALPGARILGVGPCVIEGRPYAHYVLNVDGGLISVFLPFEGSPMPAPGEADSGNTAFLSIADSGSVPAAVIVSDDLSPQELARFWTRA